MTTVHVFYLLFAPVSLACVVFSFHMGKFLSEIGECFEEMNLIWMDELLIYGNLLSPQVLKLKNLSLIWRFIARKVGAT